jgi:hypothetical protein
MGHRSQGNEWRTVSGPHALVFLEANPTKFREKPGQRSGQLGTLLCFSPRPFSPAHWVLHFAPNHERQRLPSNWADKCLSKGRSPLFASVLRGSASTSTRSADPLLWAVGSLERGGGAGPRSLSRDSTRPEPASRQGSAEGDCGAPPRAIWRPICRRHGRGSPGPGAARNCRINPMQSKSPMHLSRRCGARTKQRSRYQSPAMPNDRCKSQ